MSTGQNVENKPSQPAPDGKEKEQADVVLAYAGDKVYEIPQDVATKYESQDDHDQQGGQEDDDEVGGRDRRWDSQRQQWLYHGQWAHGVYIWITDGRTYRGWHWHPNQYSPMAYDMDNY